jgi:hypothetical protein
VGARTYPCVPVSYPPPPLYSAQSRPSADTGGADTPGCGAHPQPTSSSRRRGARRERHRPLARAPEGRRVMSGASRREGRPARRHRNGSGSLGDGPDPMASCPSSIRARCNGPRRHLRANRESWTYSPATWRQAAWSASDAPRPSCTSPRYRGSSTAQSQWRSRARPRRVRAGTSGLCPRLPWSSGAAERGGMARASHTVK